MCTLQHVERPILVVAILTTFSTVAQVRTAMMEGIVVRTWKYRVWLLGPRFLPVYDLSDKLE